MPGHQGIVDPEIWRPFTGRGAQLDDAGVSQKRLYLRQPADRLAEAFGKPGCQRRLEGRECIAPGIVVDTAADSGVTGENLNDFSVEGLYGILLAVALSVVLTLYSRRRMGRTWQGVVEDDTYRELFG